MRLLLSCILCLTAPVLAMADAGAGGVITSYVPSVPKLFLPDFGIAADTVYERSSISRKDPRFNQSLEEPRLRDGQLVAFSPIDPYANAQFTIDLPENGQAVIEEAWLYFDKLPWDVSARVGRFLPQFGLLDLTNTFQLPMLDRPSAIGDYLGSDGMDSTGLEVGFYVPNPWDLNMKADLEAVRGDALGESSLRTPDLAYLGTLDYSQDFLTAGSLQAGVSAAQGPSPYGLSEALENPYLQIQYAPSQRRIWTWSVEGMFAQRRGLGAQNDKRSFYTFLDYNFALYYHLGLLADYAQVPGALSVSYPGAFPDAYTGAPASGADLNLAGNFSWFISDNTRLRVQYTHSTPLGPTRPDETVALQATFSMGNLKQLQ